MSRRICSLLSGGKDSNYALYRALREGYELACIVGFMPRREDSWMFHVPYVPVVLLQAKAMETNAPVFLLEVSGVKEREVEEAARELKRIKEVVDFDIIVGGGLASRYQLDRAKKIASIIGVDVYTPSWGVDQEEYMKLLVREGFEFIVTRITTMGLPPRFLGKIINYRDVEEIIALSEKYGFNPSFEGGEAETLVVYAPHYQKRICLRGRKKSKSEFEHELIVEEFWLGDPGTQCINIID